MYRLLGLQMVDLETKRSLYNEVGAIKSERGLLPANADFLAAFALKVKTQEKTCSNALSSISGK